MSAGQGGSFATLLLTIPLAAIPVMAVFGIPEFVHVTASDDPERAAILRQPSLLPSEHPGDFKWIPADLQNRAADLLAPRDVDPPDGSTAKQALRRPRVHAQSPERENWTVRPPGAAVAGSHPGRPLSADLSAIDSQAPSPRPMPTSASTSRDAELFAQSMNREAASDLRWRQAARRLEDVGITEYQLKRGHRKDRFLFVCLFSPGSDPRIIQRFEAEAAEPLTAVEDVLTQVDHWLQNRYTESRRWVR